MRRRMEVINMMLTLGSPDVRVSSLTKWPLCASQRRINQRYGGPYEAVENGNQRDITGISVRQMASTRIVDKSNGARAGAPRRFRSGSTWQPSRMR